MIRLAETGETNAKLHAHDGAGSMVMASHEQIEEEVRPRCQHSAMPPSPSESSADLSALIFRPTTRCIGKSCTTRRAVGTITRTSGLARLHGTRRVILLMCWCVGGFGLGLGAGGRMCGGARGKGGEGVVRVVCVSTRHSRTHPKPLRTRRHRKCTRMRWLRHRRSTTRRTPSRGCTGEGSRSVAHRCHYRLRTTTSPHV